MRLGKNIVKAIVAIFCAGMLSAGTASAVAPDVVVNNGPTSYVIHVTDMDTTSPANVIGKVDWSTVKFFLNGFDFTPVFLGLVGTPFFQITLPSPSTVTFTIPVGLNFFAGRVAVCYYRGVGAGTGACGTNQTVLREPACTPEPGCYEQGAEMPSNKIGSSWTLSAFEFTTATPLVLTELVGIGFDNGLQVPSWNTMAWTLNIWDSPTAFGNSALAGNVVNSAALSEAHIAVGNPAYLNYEVTLRPTSPNGIFLNPGSYVIGVRVDGDAWQWRETQTDLGTDLITFHSSVGSFYEYTTYLSYQPGTSYLRMKGY